MSRVRIALIPLAVALLLWPVTLRAQLSVARISNLDFGLVVAGSSAVVPPADGRAAKFQVAGRRNTTVLITFSLPASAGGTATPLPLAFDASSGLWADRDRVTSATAFDPRQPLQVRLSGGAEVFVWIGARTTPSSNQPAGQYQGSIVLTAVQQ